MKRKTNLSKYKMENNMGQFIDAANAIQAADSLIVSAGAGMGVDSGLPDFRGNEGFWEAYPALGQQELDFTDIASPFTFKSHPELAWGFYGHRLNLYRNTEPHKGFKLLKKLGESMKYGYFVYTSNVDGQFQKAGFDADKIVEIHGSIHHMQCSKPCKNKVISSEGFYPETNDTECLLISELPVCPHCGQIMRPNILMFDDWHWISERTYRQKKRYKRWIGKNNKRVIIELGAGTEIPSIRIHSEHIKGQLIRINPRESGSRKKNVISINMTALKAIELIYDAWKNLQKI